MVKILKGLLLFRVDISDTLMYVYEMLGAELLSSLYDKLGRLLTSSEEPYSWQVPPHRIPSALSKSSHPSPKSSHGTLFLQHTEALLYGFQSIAETIDVNYSDVVPGLIGLIPRISISNVQLADTVMFTIGEAWHTSVSTVSGLQHPSLSMAGLLGPVQTERDTSSPTQSALPPAN